MKPNWVDLTILSSIWRNFFPPIQISMHVVQVLHFDFSFALGDTGDEISAMQDLMVGIENDDLPLQTM